MTPEAIDATLDQLEAGLRDVATNLLKLKDAAPIASIQQDTRLAMAIVRFETHLSGGDMSKVDKINRVLEIFSRAMAEVEAEDED